MLVQDSHSAVLQCTPVFSGEPRGESDTTGYVK